MALADNEIWANQNPPSPNIEDASVQAQNDMGQGIMCGQPINPDGINFALHKYSSCLKGELQNFVALSGIAYDPDNPTNLADAFSDIFCTWLSSFTFQQTVTGTSSVSVSLPAGGSWCWMATVHGINDDGSSSSNGGMNWFFFDTGSDDEIMFGSGSGINAGGFIVSATQNNFDNMLMTVKAFNMDCPV